MLLIGRLSSPLIGGIKVRDILIEPSMRNGGGLCSNKLLNVGYFPRQDGTVSSAQAFKVYSINGKGATLMANAGGAGAKTGLYAIPIEYSNTPQVYKVSNGFVTIHDTNLPMALSDGYYIIRSLSPIEVERMQTLPDNYTDGVSNAQRYKTLGNGWTAEVIIHILNGVLKNVDRNTKIVVLSLYDGIATGRYCFDKLGFNNIEYYAYEIDKYAIQIARKNYPDIVACGDAFAVRDNDWSYNNANTRI